jgi:hypothetical protein
MCQVVDRILDVQKQKTTGHRANYSREIDRIRKGFLFKSATLGSEIVPSCKDPETRQGKTKPNKRRGSDRYKAWESGDKQ